ncbi:oxidoreductase, partial [Streptomyces sp. NPDC093109]
ADATCPPTTTDPKPTQDQSEDHFQTTSVDQGSAIADAIAYALAQPPEVDVNEIVVRPTASAQ